MVPLWAFAVVGFWAVIATLLHVVRSRFPLPFFDKGSAIFSAKSILAQKLLLHIAAKHRLMPVFRADSSFAKRAILSNGWIINIPLDKRFHSKGGGMALCSTDPVRSAKQAIKLLSENGFSAQLISNPDTDMPFNSMAFVETDALLEGMLLIFRVNVAKMPKPSKYKSEDCS